MTRSRGFTQDINAVPRGRVGGRTRHRVDVMSMMNGASRYGVALGRRLGGSVAVAGSEVAFGRVVLRALMAQCRGDRGNSDLAVAAVEVGILAPGVLALLRCLRCVHDCSPIRPSVARDTEYGE